MWKRFLISIVLVFFIGISVNFLSSKKKYEDDNTTNEIIEEKKVSSSYITDDCINEWEDYALSVQEEIEDASKTLNDENRHYILKAQNDFINVYYINENKEEILYRVTDIATEYLTKDDLKNLNQGIEVIGIKELNELLEDFE